MGSEGIARKHLGSAGEQGGAPIQFDDKAREKFLSGIRTAAMSIKTAAAWAGVSDETVRRHRHADPAFAAAVELALEEFKARSQVLIAAAGRKSWQARAWMLERRFPAEFARQRIELSGVDGGAIPIKRIENALEAGDAIRADADLNHRIHEALGEAIGREQS